MKTFTIAATLLVGVALARPQAPPAATPDVGEPSCLSFCWPAEAPCPPGMVRIYLIPNKKI